MAKKKELRFRGTGTLCQILLHYDFDFEKFLNFKFNTYKRFFPYLNFAMKFKQNFPAMQQF